MDNHPQVTITEQRRRAAMRRVSYGVACITRDAFLSGQVEAVSRRGFDDAYELGAVGFARRGVFN